MTFAPQSITEARQFLLDVFDMHPGELAADLDPDEVGIVGDPAHRGGYHCGRDRVDAGSDYSVVESPRDRAGLTLAASALDVGEFDQVVAGQRVTLRTLSLWLVEQCKAGTPDTRDIREVIYSPDGATVRRWDRLGHRTSGDSSHLTHTHISYFRDSEARSKRPLFERFVAHLRGEKEEIMGQQMLVRFSDAADPNQVWLCDGIHRRPVDAADLPGVGNAQTHQAGLLGPLGNGGAVFVSAGNPDVWGTDVRASVKVDAGELATALLGSPAFAATLTQAAFDGAQRAERE